VPETEQTDDAQVVYTFPKNSREEVRATLKTWQGHRLADLRVWAADDEGDEDHPTKKGLCLTVANLPKLLEAVQALIAAEQA
jgi:Transcriptional Coactivator p15 (PC4)